MKSVKSLMAVVAVAAAMSVAVAAHAATIAGLYNTGVDDSGVATVGNGADMHWTLDGGAAYTGATNGVFPIGPWVPDSAVSRWITPTANASDSFDPDVPGYYTYATTFDLTASQAAGASFTGQFSADNTVTEILLNGNLLGSGGGFTGWTDFSAVASDFVAGENTLAFVVENYAQNGGNPTGLNVQFLSSVAGGVPEPGTWGLMIAGVGLMGMSLRQRRSAIVRASAA
jgi:hypothetical protein